jgi:hypothetical protein
VKKLNQRGFAHWILPLFVVAMIGLIGVKVLSGSHADSLLGGSMSQVSNLQVIGNNSSSVSLTWTPLSGATGYNVYRDKKVIAQTKAYTASYLDSGLKHRRYNYTVSPIGSNTQSSKAQADLRKQTTIALSQCGTYHYPGNYVLTADLTGSSTCLTFNPASGTTPVSGVNLDCQGHTISSGSVIFQHINNSILDNCNINGPYNSASSVFFVNSANDTIGNNTFTLQNPSQAEATGLSKGPYLDFYSVSNSVADNNTFTGGGYIVIGDGGAGAASNNNEVNNNNITSCTSLAHCKNAVSILGSNNTVAYNTVTGNGGLNIIGKTSSEYGTEYGINMVSGSGSDSPTYANTNNTVAYNNISGLAYYGIDFGVINNNDQITNNQLSGIGEAGFGNQYTPNSMTGNNFSNNTVSNSSTLFSFAIQSIGHSPLLPGMTTVAFSNNTFDTNIFHPGTSSGGGNYTPWASSFNFDSPNPAYNVDYSESNNVFKNNIFDTSLSADPAPLTPGAAFIDGGTNQWCPNLKGFTNSPQCGQ